MMDSREQQQRSNVSAWSATADHLAQATLSAIDFPALGELLRTHTKSLSVEEVVRSLLESDRYDLIPALRTQISSLFYGRSLAVSETPEFSVSIAAIRNYVRRETGLSIDPDNSYFWELLKLLGSLEQVLPPEVRYGVSMEQFERNVPGLCSFCRSLSKEIFAPSGIVEKVIRRFEKEETPGTYERRLKRAVRTTVRACDLGLFTEDLGALLQIMPDATAAGARACYACIGPENLRTFMAAYGLQIKGTPMATLCGLWNCARLSVHPGNPWPAGFDFDLIPAAVNPLRERLLSSLQTNLDARGR